MELQKDNMDFESKLWLAADKLRGSMDASEYKHVVLGLIFLKYTSDSFQNKYEELIKEGKGFEEKKERYTKDRVFFVPSKSRWNNLLQYVSSSKIGQAIDEAMEALEAENPSLQGVLNKNYSRDELNKKKLGELVTLFNQLEVGTDKAKEQDILGRVYEYFLTKFAGAEGKLGGEFYTPSCVVRTLVEMLEPYKGKVYDPACGSGGMFCQSAKFVKEHAGNMTDIYVYGQESNPTTWKLAKMNLALRHIDADLGSHHGDTFYEDMHPELKADYILANPPFNVSDWGGEELVDDKRWGFGVPPAGNANYAWLQHMLYHLNSSGGVCGTVLANGSLSSITTNEGNIRANMIKEDVVECIVSMPKQLFYSTSISVCLWIMRKGKNENTRGKVLFIDARNLGEMIDRKIRELSKEDISKISSQYHQWKNGTGYKDRKGFCKVATLDEIERNQYMLIPGWYVGTEEVEEEQSLYEEKMKQLTIRVKEQFVESRKMERTIIEVLEGIGIEL